MSRDGGRTGGRGSASPPGSGARRPGSSGGAIGRPRPGGRGPAAAAGTMWDRPAPPRGLDGTQVEGRQAVRELLMAGHRKVRVVMMAEGTDESAILTEIEELATEARVPIRRMHRDQIDAQARTEAPQGVIAQAAELREADADELLESHADRPIPFILALDGLTDPRNLGALLRSADGAGVTGVLLPRHRAVHVTPAVAKSAAGAIEHLPLAIVSGLPSFLLKAKEKGVWVIGLDADSPTTVFDLAHMADQPVIVVVGAEGDGLSRLVRQRCDVIAAIPLRGRLASLNASVAGAVALFELGRHRQRAPLG